MMMMIKTMTMMMTGHRV